MNYLFYAFDTKKNICEWASADYMLLSTTYMTVKNIFINYVDVNCRMAYKLVKDTLLMINKRYMYMLIELLTQLS